MNSNTDAISTITEKIRQRSENVALTAEQRRIAREAKASATENSDFFSDKFNEMKEVIEAKVGDAKTVEKSDLKEFLDGLVEDVGKMQTLLNESSMFLPSFKIKKAQEAVNQTNDLVIDCIKALNPPKKFGFKSKKDVSTLNKPNRVSKNRSDAIDGNANESVNIPSHLKTGTFSGFKDSVGEVLSMCPEELGERQINLERLTNCKVVLLGNPSSLQVSSLTDTTVIVGPTSRSAFIKDCQNCKFVLACQQVRIHDSRDTKFYLHVTGAAIIENCKNVSFGPYTLLYEGLQDHFSQSGLSQDVNNWNSIDDFFWLNEKEKSPNFSYLNEKEWETNWL